jgi:hypothetical protein
LAKGTILVKLLDSNGKTLPHNAKELLNLSELQTLVINGICKKDEGFSLNVKEIFVRKK